MLISCWARPLGSDSMRPRATSLVVLYLRSLLADVLVLTLIARDLDAVACSANTHIVVSHPDCPCVPVGLLFLVKVLHTAAPRIRAIQRHRGVAGRKHI